MNAMSRYSTENIEAGMPTQDFHNYDVLLLPSVDDEPARFAPGNHVGNQRFRVLLSLFRQRYLQADMLGDEDECEAIAQEVVETVCIKCVPNGRFFKRHGNKWEQCGRESPSTHDMIQNALKNDPSEDSDTERCPKKLRRSASGFDLLYQAASKELPAPVPQDEFVDSPNPFDVVCEPNGTSMRVSDDRRYTGNNRLKIMVQIRKPSYKISDHEGKQSIAEEITSSIIDDAGGLFLELDKPSGMYRVMTRASAIASVRKALDSSAVANKKKYREAEVKKLVQRKHKKAILDRLEKRKGAAGKDGLYSFPSAGMPTKFNTFLRPRTVGSRAA